MWHDVKPFMAALLSLIFPGLGQFLAGRWLAGLLFMIGHAINLVLLFEAVGVVTLPLLWIWAVVHAFLAAKAPPRGGYGDVQFI